MNLAINDLKKTLSATQRDISSLETKIGNLENELSHKRQFEQEMIQLIEVAEALEEGSSN